MTIQSWRLFARVLGGFSGFGGFFFRCARAAHTVRSRVGALLACHAIRSCRSGRARDAHTVIPCLLSVLSNILFDPLAHDCEHYTVTDPSPIENTPCSIRLMMRSTSRAPESCRGVQSGATRQTPDSVRGAYDPEVLAHCASRVRCYLHDTRVVIETYRDSLMSRAILETPLALSRRSSGARLRSSAFGVRIQ